MINPEKKTIDDILISTSVNYTVPNYQRSFDWGKEELQEFLDDLADAADNDDRDLFLGNFIFESLNQ